MNPQEGDTSGFSQKTRPLHDCACCFISVLKSSLAHMPFPFGSFIVTVDRWTHPLTQCLEHHGLHILAAVDDEVLAMGSFAVGFIFCIATQAKKVLSLLCRRGIVGTSAQVWLKYEGIVKEDIQKAIRLANKIPLVKYVTPAILTVSRPLAVAVSDWLSRQAGQQVEKSAYTDTIENSNLVAAKQEVEMERPNIEMEAPRGIDATSTADTDVGDAHLGAGEDVGADDFFRPGKTEAKEDDFVEHPSGKDVNVDDEVLAETLSVHDSMTEDDVQLADTSLADVKVDNSTLEAGETLERPLRTIPEGAHSLPDVLEMIDSSWLRGQSSSSPPQASLPSRTRSDGYGTLKTFFFG